MNSLPALLMLLLRLLLAAALYGFLFWGLWLLWRDLRRSSRQLASAPVPPLTLTALDGSAPEIYRITQLEALIGRDTTSLVCLDDHNISARHARLSYHHAQWWIEDLQSTNGSWLNDQPVEAPVVLSSGDELRFGALAYIVSIEDNGM